MSMVWLNGALVDADKARIDPSDRGFLLSAGLFETILIRDGKPVFLTDHLARLRDSAARLGIPLEVRDADLTHALSAVIDANNLTSTDRGALRLTLTEGAGPRGLLVPKEMKPTLLISAAKSGAPAPSVKAITSAHRRNELSGFADLKALPYLDQVLARREAAKAEADTALIFNTRDRLCCAAAANIFLWDSNTLLTPPLVDGCLNGITRAKIIALAQANNVAVFEESITAGTLKNVESAFVTNSLVGIQELSALDSRPLGPHPLTPKLRTALDQAERASISD